MKPNKFNDFAEISLSTYNLKNLNIEYEKAISALSKEIESEYKELNSEKVKTGRCNFFKISNIEKEDYKEHIIDISPGRKMICGIRHLNMKADKAFVNILTNFKTTKKELLKIYQTHLCKYFEPFKPKHLRYYTKQEIVSDVNSNCYLVQNASAIKKEIVFDQEKDMNLISPQSDSYYKMYIAEYEKFHQKNPAIKNRIPYNDLQLMENSRKDGLLKEVEYLGNSIGLIAGLKDEFLGHPGIYFIELLLKEKWRGKGLAKAMQRKYVNEICNDDEIVWGTIDKVNKPSLKTAKANLRMEIRYENFLKI